MTSNLLELAKRCEEATGPDAKLDEAIEKALPCSRRFAEDNPHAPPTQWNERGAAFHGARIGDCDNFDEYVSPRYTASIDAAMALFPEGYFPVLDADPRHIEVEVQYLTDETDNGLGACVATGGKTIALALCAASLRARADGAGE